MTLKKILYLLICVLLIGVAVFVWIDNRYLPLPVYRQCNLQGVKHLVNQDSLALDYDQVIKNKTLLVAFFFTRCESVCPRVTLATQQLLQALNTKHEGLRILSISVDPENDVPSELIKYRKRFQINNPDWIHATGERSKIYALISNQFGLSVTPTNKKEDDFFHSPQIVLVDKNQQIRGYYDGTDSTQIKLLQQHLRQFN